jgi:hypothetical protein
MEDDMARVQMDETNSAQVIDTGPLEADVMQARMTLTERDLMDRMVSVRRQLSSAALDSDRTPYDLERLTRDLTVLHARLTMLRQLRDGLL